MCEDGTGQYIFYCADVEVQASCFKMIKVQWKNAFKRDYTAIAVFRLMFSGPALNSPETCKEKQFPGRQTR